MAEASKKREAGCAPAGPPATPSSDAQGAAPACTGVSRVSLSGSTPHRPHSARCPDAAPPLRPAARPRGPCAGERRGRAACRSGQHSQALGKGAAAEQRAASRRSRRVHWVVWGLAGWGDGQTLGRMGSPHPAHHPRPQLQTLTRQPEGSLARWELMWRRQSSATLEVRTSARRCCVQRRDQTHLWRAHLARGALERRPAESPAHLASSARPGEL